MDTKRLCFVGHVGFSSTARSPSEIGLSVSILIRMAGMLDCQSAHRQGDTGTELVRPVHAGTLLYS